VKLHDAMMETTKGIQEVVSDLRKECSDIMAASQRVHRGVDSSRRALHHALLHHQDACRCARPADELKEGQERGR
jgi:hypothetical protein